MSNILWLKPNMDLKKQTADPVFVSISNTGNLDADFYKYSQNFHDVAEEIIRHLLEDAASKGDIAKLDTWYFALVYLYRQSLELMLKACVFQIVSLESDRKTVIENVRHDVKRAFDEILSRKNFDLSTTENGQWLSDYLADISSIDSSSDMFRYPFGQDMSVLFETQTHISLIATYENFERAYQTIKGMYDYGQILEKDYFLELIKCASHEPRLIIEGDNYYWQSVVGYRFARGAFYPYFTSYDEVGEYLADFIENNSKFDFFIPMCYMFRNSVELGLKRLIVEDSHIVRDKALKTLYKKKHSVVGLWNIIKTEIDAHSNAPVGDTTMADADCCINSLHDFDIYSDKFRYPCDIDLKTYFKPTECFDLKNVTFFFKALCEFLDCVHWELSIVKDYEAEMLYEEWSNYEQEWDTM